MMEGKMIDATRQLLGEEQILDKSWEEIEAVFNDAWDRMVEELEGKVAWNKLSKNEQALKHAAMTKKTFISLGEDKYSALSEDEKRKLDFSIWVGCGCHKNMNSVLDGNAGMMAWWDKNDVTSPIILANKDNAAILNDVTSTDDLTPVEQQALTKHLGMV